MSFSLFLSNYLGLQFNVVKCSSDVCYLRLDFESFDINGLSESLEYDNANDNLVACQDKFKITVRNHGQES